MAVLLFGTLTGCDIFSDQMWYSATDADRALLARMEEDAERHNRSVHLALDSSQHTLAALRQAPLADVPELLVSEFGLPIVYSVPIGRDAPTAYRLIDAAACDAVDKDRTLYAFEVRTTSIGGSGGVGGAPCILHTSEAPRGQVFQLSTKVQRAGGEADRLDRYVTTLRAPDGRSVELIHYSLRYASPSERIAADLGRSLGQTGSRQSRRPLPADEVSRLIAQIRASGAQAEEQRLLAFLGEEEATYPIQDDVERLALHPDLLRRNAERIVAKFAEEQANHSGDGSGPQLAGDIVSLLPGELFQEHSRHILSALESGPQRSLGRSDRLIRRLHEFGPAAIPALAQLRAGGAGAEDAQLDSICRIGAPAAPALGNHLLRSWVEANQWVGCGDRPTRGFPGRNCRPNLSSSQSMIYITLRRLGLGDQAEAEARHGQARRYRSRASDIGPQSPPSRCTSANL